MYVNTCFCILVRLYKFKNKVTTMILYFYFLSCFYEPMPSLQSNLVINCSSTFPLFNNLKLQTCVPDDNTIIDYYYFGRNWRNRMMLNTVHISDTFTILLSLLSNQSALTEVCVLCYKIYGMKAVFQVVYMYLKFPIYYISILNI